MRGGVGEVRAARAARAAVLTRLLIFVFVLEQVAIKLESTKTKHPQLLYESKIYRILHGGCELTHARWVLFMLVFRLTLSWTL